MSENQLFDIAVIGAGIAGASLGSQVAPQRSVVVLERESQPGYHTTGRSAAMFMESYGPAAVRAMTRASRAFYLAPPTRFCERALLSPRGSMVLAQPGQEVLLEHEFNKLTKSCPGLRQLPPDAALALVPCLRPELLAAAMLDDAAMDIDVHQLHQAYLRQLRRCGGEVRTRAAVVSARHTGSAWELTMDDKTTLRAAVVVNAAGAWADQVGALFGAQHIGLVPRRRTAFTFKPPEGVAIAQWPVVSGVDESYYFKPDAGVLLGSPANADPMPPHDVVPEELDVATGIHHIEAATTMSIRRPERSWAGLRSFVSDGEMVIGWDTQCQGMFWLAAQGGYGIQSAPGAALLGAALLCGQPLPDELLAEGIDLGALSPERLRQSSGKPHSSV